MSTRYTFRAKVWRYPGLAAWYFVTLPKKESKEISARFAFFKRGWGSLPILVTVGKTTWKTSIFPDKKAGVYLLPIKSEVRKAEKIKGGDTISLSLQIQTGIQY